MHVVRDRVHTLRLNMAQLDPPSFDEHDGVLAVHRTDP